MYYQAKSKNHKAPHCVIFVLYQTFCRVGEFNPETASLILSCH